MENAYIKKLVLFILTILSIFIFVKTFPYVKLILLFILKILIPFIIAFVLAFILQPIVVFFQKYEKSRVLAVITVVTILLAIIIILFKTTIPYSIKETKLLIENFPKIIQELEEMVNKFANKFDFLPINYQPTFDNINTFLTNYINEIDSLPQNIFDKFLNYISIIVIVPIVLLYLLLDYEKILCKIRDYLISKNRIRFKDFLGELNKKMSLYFRGTFLVMLILIIVCTTAFYFAHLSYPLFFACIIAVTNVIPYIGPYIGGAFPVVFALLSSPQKAFAILIIVIIVQLIESNFLTPYIQSKQTDNHPLMVILFLLIFEHLFGIIGMLIAVPFLIIFSTILKYYPLSMIIDNIKR